MNTKSIFEFHRYSDRLWFRLFNFVMAFGFFGNCGREFTIHFQKPCKGLIVMTIRTFNRRHTETTFWIRLGQKTVEGKSTWAIEMSSVHILRVFMRIFHKRVSDVRWEEQGEFRWGPFHYVYQNAPHGDVHFLYLFGKNICWDI